MSIGLPTRRMPQLQWESNRSWRLRKRAEELTGSGTMVANPGHYYRLGNFRVGGHTLRIPSSRLGVLRNRHRPSGFCSSLTRWDARMSWVCLFRAVLCRLTSAPKIDQLMRFNSSLIAGSISFWMVLLGLPVHLCSQATGASATMALAALPDVPAPQAASTPSQSSSQTQPSQNPPTAKARMRMPQRNTNRHHNRSAS